jgi:hypothetical protein
MAKKDSTLTYRHIKDYGNFIHCEVYKNGVFLYKDNIDKETPTPEYNKQLIENRYPEQTISRELILNTERKRDPRSNISDEVILEIRRKRKSGMTLAVISREYGILANKLSDICTRNTYKHVAEEF